MESTSEKVRLGAAQEIGWHVWKQHGSDATGPLVIVYHGFLAHGRYPTVRYAAELCAKSLPGSTVISADMPGHGLSDGPRGYLPGGAQSLIQDFGQKVLQTAREKYDSDKTRKVFLLGSSMGGTIALQVALREPNGSIAGVVLLAPMLKLSVSSVEEAALSFLSLLLPSWNLIPSSSTCPDKQYRDPAKRAECENDTLTIKCSKIRVGSALTCVQLARTAMEGIETSTLTYFPVWNAVADEDVVVDKTGSFDLHKAILEAGGSSTMPVYKALHGLLCEPSPLFEQISGEMITWIKEKL